MREHYWLQKRHAVGVGDGASFSADDAAGVPVVRNHHAPDGAQTTDRFGNVVAVADPLGNATVYEYDLRGRKTYEGGATYPVRYTYDVFGNKTSMTTYRDESLGPGSGDGTIWLYDETSNCMTNKIYADGKGPKYSYTPSGKLSRRIWARGIITDYAYDGWGNLTNTVYSDNTPASPLGGPQIQISEGRHP